MHVNKHVRSLGRCLYLNVPPGGHQHGVVGGEVQVRHPAAVERVHGVLVDGGTDLQQGAVRHVPEL